MKLPDELKQDVIEGLNIVSETVGRHNESLIITRILLEKKSQDIQSDKIEKLGEILTIFALLFMTATLAANMTASEQWFISKVLGKLTKFVDENFQEVNNDLR